MTEGGDGTEVLTSLPRTRPHRRSTKRGAAGAGGATRAKAPKAKPATRAKAAAPKAAASARPKAVPSATRLRQPAQPPGTPPRPPGAKPPPTAAEQAAERPTGTDVIGTAVRAAGELAEIGLTLGTQVLRNALERLPRP